MGIIIALPDDKTFKNLSFLYHINVKEKSIPLMFYIRLIFYILLL